MATGQMALELLVTAKDQASKQLDSVGESLKKINLGALAIGAVGVGGVVALGKGLMDAAKAAADEEVSIARLASVVQSSGADWNTAQAAIDAYLAAEAKRIALDDGAGRDSIARLTAATGSYQQALAAMPAVADLAAGANLSLESATKLVSMALSGNTAGLAKYGIKLEKGASQTEILAAITARFGGTAEAMANTYEGSQKKLDIALGNLKETIGALVLPILAQFTGALANIAMDALPMVQAAIDAVRPVAETVFTAIGSVVTTMWSVISPLFSMFAGWLTGEGTTTLVSWQTTGETVFNAIQSVITTVLSATQAFIGAFLATISAWWNENGALVQKTTQTVFNAIQTTITTILSGIQAFWRAHGDEVVRVVTFMWNTIQTLVSGALTLLSGLIISVMQAINGNWRGAWETIRDTVKVIWEYMRDQIVQKVLDDIKRKIELAIDGIRTWIDNQRQRWNEVGHSLINGLRDGIIGAAQGAVNAAVGVVKSAIDAAKALLGIKSPSTVFMDIGHQMAAGMVIGLARGLPAVRDTLQAALSGVAMPSAAFTAQAAVGAGTTSISYTLNYTATRAGGEADAATAMRMLKLQFEAGLR